MTNEPAEQESPQKWLRLIESGDADPLDVLRTVGTYQRYLAAIEERAVTTARRLGLSWEEIAGAIGVTRQSAWGKYQPRLLATADVAFSGRRMGPTSIRLKCPNCGGDEMLGLKRREGSVYAVAVPEESEFSLPGNVRWRCSSCGSEHDRRVEQPPFFGAA